MRPLERIDTDVLVVGGGIGGASAALAARASGAAKVTMAVKGFLGRSSCSILAAVINKPPLDPDELGEEHRQKAQQFVARHYQHYLLEEDYVLAASEYINDRFFDEIEEMGLYLLRREDGKLVSSPAELSVLAAHEFGATARLVSDLLRKRIFSDHIEVREELMVTSLLQDRDRNCIGAFAYDYRNDCYLVYRTPVVILATGHTNYLAARSTGTRDMTGNGFAMALRAGAELQNLEMQWWHISDVASPPCWMRYHNYPNPLLETSEVVANVNHSGVRFFDQRKHPLAVAPYYLQMRALHAEVQRGEAAWNGRYYADYRHIPQDVLERYHSMPSTYRKLGLELSRDLIECAITWHMTAGGVRVDHTSMSTNVAGLLVAGSVGGHYLGGIPYVYYDGKIAGRSAARSHRASADEKAIEAAVAQEMTRLEGLRTARPDHPLTPAQVKARIRTAVWENLGYVKSYSSLQSCLEELSRIEAEALPRMRLGREPKGWSYELVDALDVPDMLEVAGLAARFSTFRTESRGPFYRSDYPLTDNENWLCHVVGSGADGGLQLRKEPVHLDRLRPHHAREDFFAYQ